MTIEAINTGSEIDVLPPARPMAPNAIATLREHAEAMSAAYDLASRMCGTSLVPERFRNKPDDGTAAILYGAELGLNPIQSLQRIFVVHGTPAIEARTMVALLKQRGYRISTVSTADDEVTVEGVSPGGHTETATWTYARAAKAGYTPQKDTNGKWKTNSKGNMLGNEKYITDPQAMLYAKAAAEVCRKLAPDVLLGMPYSREDLESEPRHVETTRTTTRAPERARGVAALAQRVSTPETPAEANPATPPPDPAAMSPATRKKWVGAMFAALAEADCNDRDDQLTVITELAQRRQDPPAHRDSITDAELRQVVNALNAARKDGTLGQVVTEILNTVALRTEIGQEQATEAVEAAE